MKYYCTGFVLFLITSCAQLLTPESNLPFDHFTGDFEDSSLTKFIGLIPYQENAVIVNRLSGKYCSN